MDIINSLHMAAKRKFTLAKALCDNDFDAIRGELSRGPLVINIPKMVDGQAAPESSAARCEQTIVATSLSDDFTITQVLRHYGIERNAVTCADTTDEAAKNAVMQMARQCGYEGEVRWDANRPDLTVQ